MVKRKQFNVQCYNCKEKMILEELEEKGCVERQGDYIIVFCDRCSNEFFLHNGKGFKGHKVE